MKDAMKPQPTAGYDCNTQHYDAVDRQTRSPGIDVKSEDFILMQGSICPVWERCC